jgi:gamma-glutamyltranspeptidase/glutathione hydrolase
MSALLVLLLSATAVSPHGAAATAHPLASEAAAAVLREGGNAIDAAVAAAFVLSVVEPESSGLGGGGFALVHLTGGEGGGRDVALDFREMAPSGARPDMFAGARPEGAPSPSLDGGLAVAVPGAVKGYAELARRWGTWPLSRLVEPAARIAERGFPIGPHYLRAAAARFSCLSSRPAAARAFLAAGPAGGRALPEAGTRLRLPELARTLRRIGRHPDAFYRGPLAEAIARAARADGGVLTAADLAAYAVRERAPLTGSYRGHRIVSMPLPSSGGAIVIGLLQALERAQPAPDAGHAATSGDYRSVPFLHAMTELEKQLYARRGLLADPAFVPGAADVVARMISPAGAAELAAAVGPRAAVVEAPPAPPETSQTSHLSVIDGRGNAVALTTTVNYMFGSCVVVPGAGFVLNDEMDDFDAAPGEANVFGAVGTGRNLPAPGKIPLSSMAPTFAYTPGGRFWLALGSPGGTTIPTTVVQVVSHMVDDGMSLSQAVSTPRLHHQWRPEALQVEPGALQAETARALEARGHALLWRTRAWGNPQAVQVTPDGVCEAASDASGEGAPAAP